MGGPSNGRSIRPSFRCAILHLKGFSKVMILIFHFQHEEIADLGDNHHATSLLCLHMEISTHLYIVQGRSWLRQDSKQFLLWLSKRKKQCDQWSARFQMFNENIEVTLLCTSQFNHVKLYNSSKRILVYACYALHCARVRLWRLESPEKDIKNLRPYTRAGIVMQKHQESNCVTDWPTNQLMD